MTASETRARDRRVPGATPRVAGAVTRLTGNSVRTSPSDRTALPMAGATQTIGVSPAPADGRSGRSSRTISIGGTSLKRGTR